MFVYKNVVKLSMDQLNTLVTIATDRQRELTTLLNSMSNNDVGRTTVRRHIAYVEDAISALRDCEWKCFEKNPKKGDKK